MKKRIKWMILLVVMLATFILPTVAFAQDAGYTITAYDVNIVVNENKTYEVKETITVNFTQESRGIFRRIPLRFTAKRPGSENTEVRVLVSEVQVNEEFTTSKEGNDLVVRIGNPDVYVNGEKTYEISYIFDPGDDKISAYDEFYYQLIDIGWDTTISGVTFTIEMPKSFDERLIGFSVGGYGVSGYDPNSLKYEVNGTTIKGSFRDTFPPNTGLNIRMELPEGYFVGARQEVNAAAIFGIGSLVLAGIVIVLFVVFGRKQQVVKTVEFYPPESMTPADIGFVVDGVVEDKDVLALLIYWADKGFIEIHEEDKKNMTFKKIQDLPDYANDYERLMFNRMFRDGDTTSTAKLQFKFYDTLAVAKGRVKAKYEEKERRVFNSKSQALRELARALGCFPLAALAAMFAYRESLEGFTSFFAGIVVFFIAYAISGIYVSAVDRWQSEKRSNNIGMIVFWIIVTAVMYLVLTWLCLDAFGPVIFIAMGASFVMTLLAPAFLKRTPEGLRLYGQILGLKNFIEMVEAEKLKMMVEEDPSYFYHILPYAYVLGISDKWAKRFESLAIEPPSWYYGGNMSTFTTVYFTSMLMSSMARSQAMMLAKPSGEGGSGGSGGFGGGGGFSGGGFSGGFGGGGGGGRW